MLILHIDRPTPSATIVIRKHKTAKLLGAIIRPLPTGLLDIVIRSVELQPREALFVSPATGCPFLSEASYNAWANRQLLQLFSKPVTANTFRHAFVSQLYNQHMSTTSQQQLEDVAHDMGHSVSRQALYRRITPSTAAPVSSTAALLVSASAQVPPVTSALTAQTMSVTTSSESAAQPEDGTFHSTGKRPPSAASRFVEPSQSLLDRYGKAIPSVPQPPSSSVSVQSSVRGRPTKRATYDNALTKLLAMLHTT